MAIYARKRTPGMVDQVLVLEDGDKSRVPAGYTIERTEPGKVQVHVPVIRIGYWGWSWEFCLSFPSGWTGAARLAFRRLFESLPEDVQNSLCFAPRNYKARLDFWLDKLSAIQEPGLRVEIESVLRKELGEEEIRS